MDRVQAEQIIGGARDAVSWGEAALPDARRLVDACISANIPAAIRARDASCGCGPSGCGGGPKVDVVVRAPDVPKVANLLRSAWSDMVKKEGLKPVEMKVASDSDELPCPACGTAAPLVRGACSDCGLQLE